ncbi:hypothetical protein ACQCX5_14430 [Propionibacteriaceae bacterium G57]|uniref:hypothetical protein n=1 Tax=Aestuariimicrobium sp. G57 TaxID=3418485 RepID=UPI003DA74D3A
MSATNKWRRANQSWLTDDHAPLLQQLDYLAHTLDKEMAASGQIKAATGSTYRLTLQQLTAMKPGAGQPEPADGLDNDGLFGPVEVM